MTDLLEYQTDLPAASLRHWQTVLSRHLSDDMQSARFSIVDEMDKNLDLKASCLGARRVVMTPVTLPPSCKEVKTWCRARKMLRDIKTAQKADKAVETKSETKSTPVQIEQSGTKDVVGDTSNKFTKLKDPKSVSFVDKSPEKFYLRKDDVIEVSPDTGCKSTTPKSSKRVSKAPAKSVIKRSKPRSPEPGILDDNRADDMPQSTPTVRGRATKKLRTSTPHRRVSFEVECPPVTPIRSSGAAAVERNVETPSPSTTCTPDKTRRRGGGATPPAPATPSTSRAAERTSSPSLTPTSTRQGAGRGRSRLRKKISSGKEASLRRLLVASQLKVHSRTFLFEKR